MTEVGNAAGAQSGTDAADALASGIAETHRIGYDFAELTVRSLMELTEAQFDRLRGKLAGSSIRIPVLNSFIPPELKVTGPDADERALAPYIRVAMRRASAIGAEIIVFGSGGARRVPEGYPAERGLEQVERFLAIADEIAAEFGITVAIEPLNRSECNVINTVAQALRLSEKLRLSHIRVLADAYHMHLEGEPEQIAADAAAAGQLAHVHYAEADRSFPTGAKADGVRLTELLAALQSSGYAGRISAECVSAAASGDSAESLRYVRECLRTITTRGAN